MHEAAVAGVRIALTVPDSATLCEGRIVSQKACAESPPGRCRRAFTEISAVAVSRRSCAALLREALTAWPKLNTWRSRG